MQLILNSAPATEPVATADARAHCRAPSSDDTYIASLVKVARRMCEQQTGRYLITQTWDVLLDYWPRKGTIVLPVSPLQSVTHVKYYDGANVQQTLASSQYQVAAGLAPRIEPVFGVTWPVLYDRMQAIEIRCVVGYGNASAVPDALKHWIMVMVGHWYENREATTGREMSRLPFVDGLLDTERRVEVG